MYKRISGIYMIKCEENGDRYIGSSKSLFARKSGHWINLRRNCHHNIHLQNVWNKYGERSFSFSILEIVSDSNKLLEREQYWIDSLKPELNKALKAESGFLGMKHSEKTIEKLRAIQKKRLRSPELIERLRHAAIEQNKKQPNPMKGRIVSEEEKQRLRECTKKQFSDPERRQKHLDAMKKWMTPEMRERISKAKTGVKQSKKNIELRRIGLQRKWDNYSPEKRKERIEKTKRAIILAKAKHYPGFVSPNGKIYRDVYNLSQFCREHNLSTGEMSGVNSGKRKSHKGWTKIKD